MIQISSFLLVIHLNSDQIVAVAAVFIAVLSLFVSYRQLYVQQQFNRNQLKPLPWFYINLGADNDFFVDFYNGGEEPLIIVATTFNRAGKVRQHLESLLNKVDDHNYALLSPGKIIAAGEKVRIWEKHFDPDDEDTAEGMERLQGIFYTIQATIIYKDVYDKIYPPFNRNFNFMQEAQDEMVFDNDKTETIMIGGVPYSITKNEAGNSFIFSGGPFIGKGKFIISHQKNGQWSFNIPLDADVEQVIIPELRKYFLGRPTGGSDQK